MKDKMIRYSKIAGITLVLGIYGVFAAFGVAKFDTWRIAESKKMLSESEKVDGKDSLILLQKAAFLDPYEETYLKTGLKAEKLGLESIATGYFERVKTANGYYELGSNYLNQQKYDKAVDSFTKAIAKQKDAKYYLDRAKTYMAKADINKAKQDIKNSFGVETGDEARYYEYLIARVLDEEPKAPEVKGEFKDKLNMITAYSSPENKVIVLFNELNTQNYPQLAGWYLKQQATKGNLDRDGYLLLAKVYSRENNTRPQYEALLKAKGKDEFYPQTYQQLTEVAKKLNLSTEANSYQVYYNKLVW